MACAWEEKQRRVRLDLHRAATQLLKLQPMKISACGTSNGADTGQDWPYNSQFMESHMESTCTCYRWAAYARRIAREESDTSEIEMVLMHSSEFELGANSLKKTTHTDTDTLDRNISVAPAGQTMLFSRLKRPIPLKSGENLVKINFSLRIFLWKSNKLHQLKLQLNWGQTRKILPIGFLISFRFNEDFQETTNDTLPLN